GSGVRDEMLDCRRVAQLAVEADKPEQADVRREPLAGDEHDDPADLADEILAEIAEKHGLLGGGEAVHRLVDAVAIAEDRAGNTLLHVALSPDVAAVAVLQLA